MTFGQKLRVMRVARGLIQVDLARIVGIDGSYISLMEGDIRPVPEQTKAALRQALDWGEREDRALALLSGED